MLFHTATSATYSLAVCSLWTLESDFLDWTPNSIITCVMLDQPHNFSVTQFPYLKIKIIIAPACNGVVQMKRNTD